MPARSTHVTAYLARIGLADRDATGLGLAELVAAHNRSIPFENLDPLCDVPVADLSLPALSDKLVRRRRGGYCYEHNMLLGHVLRELGHEVDFLTGRVLWGNPATLPARTHQVLAVTPAGESERFLVDVGFGGQTLSSPIRLDLETVQPTRHEPYRLTSGADGLLLEALIGTAWRPLYVFGLEPQEQIDLEVGSWYVSTHPDSGFRRGLAVALVTDEARFTLSDSTFAVHRDGGTDETPLTDADSVLRIMRETFGLEPELPGLRAVLARGFSRSGHE